MTEKRQTWQGYIFRILQHFATKLRNITNFVMLFQAVMKFLSRLVEIKISLKRGKVYYLKDQPNHKLIKLILPKPVKLFTNNYRKQEKSSQDSVNFVVLLQNVHISL